MKDFPEQHDAGADDMGDVGRLIHYVGGREPVDASRMEQARARVGAHWETVVAAQRASRQPARLRLVALAAGIVAVAGVALVLLQSSNDLKPLALASVDRVIGAVMVDDIAATRGATIAANALITTGDDGRIALRLAGGHSLRIDTASRLLLHTPNHMSLQTGGIYIDTDSAPGAAPVLVATALGTAQDVGTQFQVRVDDATLTVGVRDGLVRVAREGWQGLSVDAGFVVEVDPAGPVSERPLGPDDQSWQWIETVTPEFQIEGASLKQYLAWYANERGLALKWEDDASEANAGHAILSGGTIADTTLDEGLAFVRKISPFDYRIEDGALWIKVR